MEAPNAWSTITIIIGKIYLPVPLPATIGQPEKQQKGSANRKRESMCTAARGVAVNNAPIKNRYN